MKLYKLTLCALLSVAEISCTKEIEQPVDAIKGDGITEISATFADSDDKTVLGSDGASILWSPGDQINVFFGKAKVMFTAINEEPSRSTIFSSKESLMFIGGEGSDDYIWAVYPYNKSNVLEDNSVVMTVPSEQVATVGSFAPGAFPSIGRSHTTSMGFFNVCGGLCFKVSNTGVTKVVLKSNGGESLAGKVKVGFDGDGRPAVSEVVSGVDSVVLSSIKAFSTDSLYYVSVLPTVLSSGFTISFQTADSKAMKSTTKSNEIKRNVFGNLGTADNGLTYESTIVIPDLVDLGLSVKWAAFNIGANRPEGYGRYFACGEVTGQTWNGSSWSGGAFERPDCKFDSFGNLKPEYDAAHMILGGDFRMPTKDECEELIDNCTCTWTDNYNGTGVIGRIFTSKKAGYTDKSIFLPSAGRGEHSTRLDVGKGFYWSGTRSGGNAWRLCSSKDSVSMYVRWRGNGFPVRPVQPVPVSSVSLSDSSAIFYVGAIKQLTSTINPSNAKDKSVIWSSSNESVATVSSDGLVTGISTGTATITVTTVDGGYSATCSITVEELSSYVDLGLSVKWATCNIGATKPEEYGKYFAWGDVTGQTWNGSSWSGGGFSSYPTYEVDSNNNLKPAYDAAHVILGGNWRMPTRAECQELIDNCTCTWTDNYDITGVAGRIFTSKKTGYTDKSIFLPAAGYGYGSYLHNAGSFGYYWSGTFYYGDYAWGLGFYSSDVFTYYYYRSSGFSVRPVTE